MARVTDYQGYSTYLDISREDGWNWSWSDRDLNPVEFSVGDTVMISDKITLGVHAVVENMLQYAGKLTKISYVSSNGHDVKLEIDETWVWNVEDLIKMDTRFKVGDKVKIISEISEDQYSVVEDMGQYAGKEAIITLQGENGFYKLSIDESKWWWDSKLLLEFDKTITLDSLIDDRKVVCAFIGKDKEFLRSSIIEIRANRSAVKLCDYDKWIPIQQIHADVETLSDKIPSDSDRKIYYQSPYLGKIELVDYDPTEEYPLLIKTSDGDEFELTLEGKLFKDSQISVL